MALFPGLPTIQFLLLVVVGEGLVPSIMGGRGWRGLWMKVCVSLHTFFVLYNERQFFASQTVSIMVAWTTYLALFLGLPTIQFLIACSIQKQRGKVSIIYGVNDVNVYRGREEPSNKRVHSRPFLAVSIHVLEFQTLYIQTPTQGVSVRCLVIFVTHSAHVQIDKIKVMFASLSVAFENHTNKQFKWPTQVTFSI